MKMSKMANSQLNLCLKLPKQEENLRALVNLNLYDGFAQPYYVNITKFEKIDARKKTG